MMNGRVFFVALSLRERIANAPGDKASRGFRYPLAEREGYKESPTFYGRVSTVTAMTTGAVPSLPFTNSMRSITSLFFGWTER